MGVFRTHLSSDISNSMVGSEVVVAGWVHNKRDLGGKKFLIIRDKDGYIQVVISKSDSEDLMKRFYELTPESVVSVRGVVKADDRAPGGFEIVPKSITVHSVASAPLPLDVTSKVKADIDTRLRERVLDLRREESKATFKIISVTLKSIREELYSNGFIEVNTPKIIATATEGGAALFPVIYFGREAFLAQSPQLYKELLAGAFERVFEIAHAWRAEESDTPYHLSEFISVDIEMAFANYETVMEVLEKVIYRVVKNVGEECSKELKVLNHELPHVKLPFKRFKYVDVIEILKGLGSNISRGDDVTATDLKTFSKEIGEDLYFIIEWPSNARPFYTKLCDSTPEFTESFDFIYSFLEIASGSSRIHRKEVLISRLREKGLNPESFNYFLRWFDFGMPPHAGWGMGLNRLALMVTGRNNVREVTLFPRDKKRLEP
ncbi:MAG: aspartate--tRNA(Asn) ligase [Sulfolobales archaeon]|nr:aspartate--tRNA(Asn) ligase [Sulfolobales archaeon]MDW7969619.1 aspartate--tRNA(Asn) ligase [Sulfolobales archaeon]